MDVNQQFPPGIDRTIREGNPNYGNRMQLYNGHNCLLTIQKDGQVKGVYDDENNSCDTMEFTSTEFGEVKIRGVEANLYLAFNESGQLYGEQDPSQEGTVFREIFQSGYNIYISKKFEHHNWYIGIKKSGAPKNGNLTKLGQKAIQFIPRRKERGLRSVVQTISYQDFTRLMGGNRSKFKDFPPGIDPTLREGNPHYGPRMQLFCRNGYHLIIRNDGTVAGDNDDNNPNAIMEFTSAGFGEVKIRGIEANLYLAFNKKGQLYGERDPFEEATVFRESLINSWNIYLSKKYENFNWYVGIKKSGKSKNGQHTKLGQKAIQFLPRRIPNIKDIIILVE